MLTFEFGNLYTTVFLGSKKLITLPTCYLLEEASGRVVTIGESAFLLKGKSPPEMKVIFPIKKGCIYDLLQFEQFFESLLVLLKKQESWSWLTTIKVVCILPERCTELDKQLFSQVFNKSGISNISYLNKSTYLLKKITGYCDVNNKTDNLQESQIAILDIGDQLTELVISSFGKTVFSQSLDFGGGQLTDAILEYLKTHHELQISLQQATDLKHRLPSLENFSIKTSGEGLSKSDYINLRGVDLSEGLVVTKKINLQSILEVLHQQLPSFVHQLKKALAKVNSQNSLSAFENGIILTGKGALLSGLDDYLANELGVNVCMSSKKT